MSDDMNFGLLIFTLLVVLVVGIGFAIFVGRADNRKREASRIERCARVLAVAITPSDSLRLIQAMPECAS